MILSATIHEFPISLFWCPWCTLVNVQQTYSASYTAIFSGWHVMCREVQTSLWWLTNEKERKTEIIKLVWNYSVHRTGDKLRNTAIRDLWWTETQVMLQCRASTCIKRTCTIVTVLVGNAMTTQDFGHSIFPVFSFESNLPFLLP